MSNEMDCSKCIFEKKHIETFWAQVRSGRAQHDSFEPDPDPDPDPNLILARVNTNKF